MRMIDKGKSRANSLVRLAKKERDERGYRENLGYDSIYELENFIKTLALSYREESDVIKYFYSQCDII